MSPFDRTDPKQFIADFFTGFHEALLSSDEEAAAVVDRFHTPDVVQIADGVRIDRERLIAHTRPVRKKRPNGRWEVHEAVADGDRIAARYTLHAVQQGKDLAIEVHFFGRFTPDGRMREGRMLTRTLPDPERS
ncbi:nuclear transport factor 2 family protein [Glycomyces sp. YM15]|uniref:nuclear transport factor 2 family protein n=1 Tax=Glycomyces sp. YM15 TaxID=2800446 RepID=UPI001962320B|nr:nuclear transport factor 2 family protein [Glycomyces sp. YM15]